jgi:hypothetical protein
MIPVGLAGMRFPGDKGPVRIEPFDLRFGGLFDSGSDGEEILVCGRGRKIDGVCVNFKSVVFRNSDDRNARPVGERGGGGATRGNTSQRSFTDCAKQTAKTAGVGIALDVAGVGLALAPPAKAAIALGGLAVGALAITNSSVNGDAVGFTAGVTAYSFAAVGPESVRLSKAAKTSTGRTIAGAIPGVGLIFAVGTLAYDSYNAYQSYQRCRKGQ